jgi:hypothetical protein
MRLAALLLAVLALYAATDIGYRSAGPAGALIAFGLGAFLAVPFVPQRVGGGRAAGADARRAGAR